MVLYESIETYNRIKLDVIKFAIDDNSEEFRKKYLNSGLYFGKLATGSEIYFKSERYKDFAKDLSSEDLEKALNYQLKYQGFMRNPMIGIVTCPCCGKRTLIETELISNTDSNKEKKVVPCIYLPNKLHTGEQNSELFASLEGYEVTKYICMSCNYEIDPRDIYYFYQDIVVGEEVKYELTKNNNNQSLLLFRYTREVKKQKSQETIEDTYNVVLNLDEKSGYIYKPTGDREEITMRDARSRLSRYIFCKHTNDFDFIYEYGISKEVLKKIECGITPFLQERDSHAILKPEFYDNEFDYKDTKDYCSITSLLKMIQQPLLPKEMYKILDEIANQAHKDNDKTMQELFSKCRQFLTDKRYYTMKDLYSYFGFSETLFKKYVHDVDSFVLYYLIKDMPKYTTDTIMQHKEEFNIGHIGINAVKISTISIKKFLDILNFKSPATKLFYKYFKENGVKDNKIQRYLLDMVLDRNETDRFETVRVGNREYFTNISNKSTVNFNILVDALTMIEMTFDEVERKEAENPIGLQKTIEAETLTPFARSFIKRVVATSSAEAFHDKCLPMLIHIKIDNIDIKYSDEMIKHISKKTTITLNGKTYTLTPAYNTRELIECSEEMGTCAVTYWKKAVDKQTNVLLVKNINEKPGSGKCYEVCIELTNNYEVTQIKGRENHSILPVLKPFIRKWIKANKLKLATKDLDMADKTYLPKLTKDNPYKNYIQTQLIQEFRNAM